MWYGIAADLVVAVHVAYCAYVVLGQVAIVVAAPFRWQWARNPWFRFSHLLAIGVVAYEALFNIRCPITVWEEQLRAMAGQDMATGQSFVGRMFHDLLFGLDMPEVFFNTVHVAIFVLVLQGLIMYPPRWFRWKRTAPAAVAPAPLVKPEPALVA